jgi:hypothetical protein
VFLRNPKLVACPGDLLIVVPDLGFIFSALVMVRQV